MHGKNKPVILFKEAEAKVDIPGFFRDPAILAVAPVAVDLDTQFSDVKDVHYATWNRFEISATAKLVGKNTARSEVKYEGTFRFRSQSYVREI